MYSYGASSTTEKWPREARLWLLTGAGALALAGFFALALIAGRAPGISNVPLFQQIFHEALVIHVDLSVLVWFLAIACMTWSLEAAKAQPIIRIPYLERSALLSFGGGGVVMALSLFDRSGEPLMSNYIPVISNPVFFIGLSLILAGVLLQMLHYVLALTGDKTPRTHWMDVAMQIAAFSAWLITAVSIAAFVWTYHLLPPIIEGQQYYDMLFWAGGHGLQFTHTQMLIIAWLLLMLAVKRDYAPSKTMVFSMLSVGPLAALFLPLPFVLFDVAGMEFHNFYTQHMIVAGGIAPAIIGLAVLVALVKSGKPAREVRALWAGLLLSILVFIYGGIIGMMIQGQNVVIPAHYHGSVGGITLAFMTLAVMLLPRFGYRDLAATTLAFWQPFVYALGVALHSGGLAWSGGYGVLRKTVGGLEAMPMSVKVAMGMMGGGGLIAAIGGLMFVIVVWRAVKR